MSFLNKAWLWVYALFLGIVSGYLVSGLVLFELKGETLPQIKVEHSLQNSHANIDVSLILKRNILGARTQENKRGSRPQIRSKERNHKLATSSDIDGYKLIGFVAGTHPIALFKKAQKPVVIVDKTSPLKGVWLLKAIKGNIVYLINKDTHQVKVFQMATSKGIKANIGSSEENHSGIERFEIKRTTVENALKDINQFFKQVRIEPYFQGKTPIGYRLGYLSNTCILKKVGLRRGDIIVSVNGQPTTDPAKMMDLFNQMREMTSVNLDILRNGERKTFFIEID